MAQVLCFSCFSPPPTHRRLRIDRTMIGQPTDFRHTGHIGSAEVNGDNSNQDELHAVQNQMRSKGGYDHVTPVHITLDVVDVHKS